MLYNVQTTYHFFILVFSIFGVHCPKRSNFFKWFYTFMVYKYMQGDKRSDAGVAYLALHSVLKTGNSANFNGNMQIVTI